MERPAKAGLFRMVSFVPVAQGAVAEQVVLPVPVPVQAQVELPVPVQARVELLAVLRVALSSRPVPLVAVVVEAELCRRDRRKSQGSELLRAK